METLPRVEQPYTFIYPHLNVENEVKLVIDDADADGAAPEDPAATTHRDAEPHVSSARSAQFNISGYVGGTASTERFLPLKHSSSIPSPVVDESILSAGLGFTDISLKGTLNTEDTPHLIRPDASMQIYQPFAYLLPNDKLDLEKHLTELINVEYDIDETDLSILGLLTTRYRVNMLPEVFEVVMSMLDLAAALLCLKMHPLERAAKEANGTISHTENRRCAVCNWAECTDSNTIVFCDGCDVAVHQDCYGVHSIPEGRWLCRKCESGHGHVQCVLCPQRSGAFKRTASGDWIHLVCALWTPNVRVPENTSFLEPVQDLELMDPERWGLNCYVCRKRRRGACIQCAAKDCFLAFHATCAQAAGFYMTNCDHDISELLRNQQYLPVYCHKHSVAHAPPGFPAPSIEAGCRALAEEEERLNRQKVSTFAKPRFPYWRTKTHALVHPHLVVGAVQRSLKNRLSFELSTAAIEFLCRYWTIKKDNNDGVMFNHRIHHALEVAELRLVRADQSEEQEFTPRELLDVVEKLISSLSPPQQPPAIEDKATKRTQKRSGAAASATTVASNTKRPQRGGSRTPAAADKEKKSSKDSLSKSIGNRVKASHFKSSAASARRTPMTRKRARELAEQQKSVASVRKLRNRNTT